MTRGPYTTKVRPQVDFGVVRRARIVAIVIAAWSHSCSGGDLAADAGANSLGDGTADGGSTQQPGSASTVSGGDDGGTADGGCAPARWDEGAWDMACWQ